MRLQYLLSKGDLMFLKKSFSIVLIICLSLSIPTRAMAKEPSAATSLGLTLATAITDEKDVSKGLTKVAKDQTSEWLWDVLGGMETIVLNTDEAQLGAITDKLTEIVGIVASIEKIAFEIGSGNFDVAAIEAMDQVVGKVNHPLVTLTWSAVKMTYESHLLVLSTKAAIQVEIIYNVVNKDRRLMGSLDPNSNEPPMLSTDKASTEYFFNKYIMTNGAARGALKAYVETVLGEEWPEQSWASWLGSFRTIGSGLDTAKDAELAMLDKEWRDKGNHWVRVVIKDVNKQVKLAWAQVCLRKAAAEFKVFSDRVGHFYNGDFEHMLRDYMDIKKFKEELPMYKATLTKSQAERGKVSQQISKLKSTNFNDAGGLGPVINNWRLKVYSYSSRAGIIGKKDLESSLLRESQEWQKLNDRVDVFIASQEGRIKSSVKSDAQDNEVKGISVRGLEGESQVANYRNKYSDEMMSKYNLKEYEWGISLGEDKVLDVEGQKIEIPSGVEAFKSALLDQCNQANIDISKEMVKVWLAAAKKHFYEWSGVLGPVSGDISPLESYLSAKEAANKAIENAITARVAFGKAAEGVRAGLPNCWGGTNRAMVDCQDRNKHTMIDYYEGGKSLYEAVDKKKKKLGIIVSGWAQATVQIREVAKRMAVVAKFTYDKNINDIGQIPSVFSKLASVRGAQASKFESILDAVLKIGSLDGLQQSLNKEMSQASENEYTFFTPIKSSSPSIASLPGLLNSTASHILQGSMRSSSGFLAHYESQFLAWESAVDLWNGTEMLSSSDIMQINVLVNSGRDLEKDIDLANKIVDRIPSSIALIQSHSRKMMKMADRDGNNRGQDAGWLVESSRIVQRMINGLIQKGWMRVGARNELEVVFSGGIVDGMASTAETFSHYMTQEELNKTMQPMRVYVNASKALSFMKTNAPDHYRKLQEILDLKEIKAAKGENFIVANRVVYADDIRSAEKVINSLRAMSKNNDSKLAEIAKLLPLTLNVMTDKELAYYENQANIRNMSLEEYYKKVLGKTPSKTDYTFRDIDLNADFLDTHELGKKYLELRQKVKDFFAEQRGAKIIAKQEANRIEQEEKIALRLEEENKKAKAKSKKMIDGMGDYELAGFYGYSIENPRLNSRAIPEARGDVVLMKGDLVSGEISVEARLFTIDKAKTILLTKDGGRTWEELGFSKDVRFSFSPLADKSYDFILRIKTVDGREPWIRIFNRVNSFVYKDTSFEQLIAGTVKDIANAYERSNISAFSDRISRNYLGNKASLEEGVRFDFDMFTNIRLTIYINRIEERRGLFVADTKWDKTQNPRMTGQEQRTSGRTTFMFVLEDGKMKIKNFRGDLMYATLSPEIAQASGKSSSVIDDIRTARDNRNPTQPGAGTTDDGGGVTSSSSTVLSTANSPIIAVPGFPGTGFDFTVNGGVAAASANSDINFESNIMFGATGLQKITGNTFAMLTTAPTAGYGTGGILIGSAGTVYAFITKEGYYGKMEILSFSGGNLQLKFAVQTNGSTSLNTQ